MGNYESSVVIDLGYNFIKAGLSTDDQPKTTLPFQGAVINDWANLEAILHRVFYDELQIDPTRHPVCITGYDLNFTQNQESVAKMLFEKFSVPAMYIANSAVLTVYAGGHIHGVVIDLGDNYMHITVVYNGFTMVNTTSVDAQFTDIPALIFETINQCDLEFWRVLYQNIVLVGQNAESPKMDDLEQKVIALTSYTDAKVWYPSHPEDLAWTGGAIMTNPSSLFTLWVTRPN